MLRDFSIKQIQEDALAYLAKHLDKCYTYHNAEHTQDVCQSLEEFLPAAALSEYEVTAIRLAAIFHDFGYLVRFCDNEVCALEYMQKFCGKASLPDSLLDRAFELIQETSFPYQPVTFSGELLCDADIEYIGRSVFWRRAEEFRMELSAHNVIMSDQQWWQREVDFLRNNCFFTDIVRQCRNAGRLENLQRAEAYLREISGAVHP